jgi:hypothetical protein
LLKHEVVVNPTGSVVTVLCADNEGPPMQATARTRRCDFRDIFLEGSSEDRILKVAFASGKTKSAYAGTTCKTPAR